jgi:flagellin-like hook-associated protein FlgL
MMRIAHSNFYTKFLADQQRNLRGLENVYSKTASGMNIQYGYENTHTYIETLRLDEKSTTLLQVKDASMKSKEFSQQTDTVLGNFTKALDTFKQKLLHAANDVHSESSRMAIANELNSLKDHLVNLANTSIAGHYLFSGSLIDQKPFNPDGTYNGNDEDLKTLIGNNNQIKYNLSGQDVFLSKDTDYFKSVTTNVKHFNQSKLHPDVMTKDNKDGNSEEKFITKDDTLRDLVGDNDDDKTNNEDVVFYVRGTNPNGDSVKEKFSIAQDDTIDKLLSKIEEAYDKSVKAEINDWGQIVVTDKKSGSSKLDFHMVGAIDRDGNSATNRADVTDTNKLIENSDLDIIAFNHSGFESEKSVTNLKGVNDKYDHRIFTVNTTFQKDGNLTKDIDKIQDVLGSDVDHFVISGNQTDGTAVANYNFAITATTTFEDLENNIKANFGNVSVHLRDGKLTIEDASIEKTGTSKLSFSLKAQDAANKDLTKFSGNQAVIMDRAKFDKNGSTLTSNVSQVVTSTGDYATKSTKLSDVANVSSLDDKSFSLKITDINGNEKNVSINLRDDNTPQSKNITAGAGTNTITLDDNFKDLKVGSTLKTNSGEYLQVTAIDPDTKQVTLSGNTGAGATSVEWLEMYEEESLAVAISAGDTTATLNTNFDVLNEGDSVDIGGQNVTITGIDKATKQITFTPAAAGGHAINDPIRYQNQGKSYFEVDGVSYSMYNENWDSKAKSTMFNMTSSETAAAVAAGYSKYDQDTVYVKSGDLAGAQVGDYIKVGNEYREIQSIDDNNAVNGRKLIKVDPKFDGVVFPEEDIELVRPTHTDSKSMTYGQLNDIIAMVASGNLPDPENKQPGYHKAVEQAQKDVNVTMNNKGQIEIKDMKSADSKLQFSIHDSSTNSFRAGEKSPALTFQSNNAITIDEQHVNFFDRIDAAIEAVEKGIYQADSNSTDPRNAGIQNAIKSIDHLNDHMSKMQTIAGSQSQRLQYTVERTEVMVVHVKELRSNVLDADLAEVANELNQRTLNYQAMLASVSKVNKLSLVNYM